jgi:hypothetical protein
MSSISLPVIKARDILNMSYSEVWDLGRGVHVVEFDNGERIKSYIARTILSRYCWSSLEKYPHMPILPHYHMQNDQLSNATAKRIMARVLEDIIRENPNHTKRDSELIWGNDYDGINRIFNDFSLNLEEYVTSTSALDFVQILMHPEIKAANDWIQKKHLVTEADIAYVHQTMLKTIKTAPDLRENSFVNEVRAGVLKFDQGVQLFGPIGNRADVNSLIFPKPIVRGYGHGLTTLYESMLESRSASRALYFQKKPMADSEWGNRIVQLMASIIQNVHDGDCGSDRYLTFTICNEGHLSDATGSFYLDETTGKLDWIRSTDKHLIGKSLQLRNPLMCQHADRNGTCSTCYGMLSHSIPDRTNIGHTSVTIVLGFLGQFILSTKHLDKTATAERLSLPLESSRYLKPSADMDMAYIADELKGEHFYVSFDAEEVQYLLDVRYVSDVSVLRSERLSNITTVYFDRFYRGVLETRAVSLGASTATPSLSMDFIRYIREVGWEIGEEGRYRVDMAKWNFNHALITLPMVQFSSPAYMSRIQSFIKGYDKKGAMSSVVDFTDMGAALQALNDIVGLKLRINITHISIVLLATKASCPETFDYRLPNPKWTGQPRKFNDLMMYRSIAAANAYQGHEKLAFNIRSFMCQKRPPHQLDWVVVPNGRFNPNIQSPLRGDRF